MNQKLTGEAIRAAVRMAADRGVVVDEASLMRAVLAVTGTCNGQDDAEEIAEDALELLGSGLEPSASRRGAGHSRKRMPACIVDGGRDFPWAHGTKPLPEEIRRRR